LYQGFLGERRGDAIQPGFSITTVQPLTTNPNGTPIPVLLSNPFPSGIKEPTGSSAGKQTSLGGTVNFFNQDPKVSKQARWSFGIQRELGHGWMIEANYVGDNGYDIEITRNINALPVQYLNTDNSRTTAMTDLNTALTGTVANPFRNLSEFAGTSFFNATISRQQLLLPFPEFGAINTTNNEGHTWYHSGQFTLQKRFSKGYGLQFAYTRSKWLQATEYLNAGDPKPTKMISDQDIPNRFSASGFYQLPFGKGQPFLSNANRLVDVIVGGWQLQGTYSYQSGFPVSFANDAFYLGGKIAIDKSEQTTARWFNTSAFASALTTTGTLATPVAHRRTLPLRFADVRIDPINNADLGLMKDIRINETMKVQLRMEFINAFNHPLFPGPVVNPSSAQFGQDARRAQLGAKFIF
jgi:hypothetical protein